MWLSATKIKKHMLFSGVCDGCMFCLWRLNEKGGKKEGENSMSDNGNDLTKSSLMS